MRVHVYRNREDERRTRSEMHFCTACHGWYGVPHDFSHCQEDSIPWKPEGCACSVCRSLLREPIEGTYGFFTTDKRWQP